MIGVFIYFVNRHNYVLMTIHHYKDLFMLLVKRNFLASLEHCDEKISVDINATWNISGKVNDTPYVKWGNEIYNSILKDGYNFSKSQ